MMYGFSRVFSPVYFRWTQLKKNQQNFWVEPTHANPAYMAYVISDFRMWNKASGLGL